MKDFYHFSIVNFELKIEVCNNVLIEWHFRCTDSHETLVLSKQQFLLHKIEFLLLYKWKSKTRVTSSDIRVTSSNLRVTSSNPRVTSWEIKSTS